MIFQLKSANRLVWMKLNSFANPLIIMDTAFYQTKTKRTKIHSLEQELMIGLILKEKMKLEQLLWELIP